MEQGKDIRGPSFTECRTQEQTKFLIHFKESEGTCLSVCKKVGNGTRGRHLQDKLHLRANKNPLIIFLFPMSFLLQCAPFYSPIAPVLVPS